MPRQVKGADMATAHWKAGFSGSAQKYRDGVANYQGNPGDVAAQPDRIALYVQRTAEAANSGRFAAALTAPGVGQRWRENALKFGAANMANGAAKGEAKYKARYAALQSYYQRASDAANALPKGDSLGRFTAAFNVMKSAKGAR